MRRMSARALAKFSAALCRGLIEARPSSRPSSKSTPAFSAALCRGLIEARPSSRPSSKSTPAFSAALCRGLIEAYLIGRVLGGELGGFPRLYAAASLKLFPSGEKYAGEFRFSAALCRGLIEAGYAVYVWLDAVPFSAALCRGLIEADPPRVRPPASRSGFPRLYAAASLKRSGIRCGAQRGSRFSAALCRGLIEASAGVPGVRAVHWFSAALCRGLIEAPAPDVVTAGGDARFPRLYAAASLKPAPVPDRHARGSGFSAALCRGLIEASPPAPIRTSLPSVFRGFMPRPH